jgi:hypothetical protein
MQMQGNIRMIIDVLFWLFAFPAAGFIIAALLGFLKILIEGKVSP